MSLRESEKWLNLYVAKIVSIGYTTSMAVQEIRVPSRGMLLTFATTEKERASDERI